MGSVSIAMHDKIDILDTEQLFTRQNDKENVFFTGGSVGKNLDLLKHLYKCSKNILVVLGEDGIGKTSYKNAILAAEKDEQNKFCCITADSTITPSILKQELLQDFDLDLDNVTSNTTNDKLFLVIDDAHSLPTNTLKYVIDLSCIQLILFGKSILEYQLRSSLIAVPKEKLSVVELTALSLKETAEYLMFQWKNTNNTGSFPFSNKQIKKIYQSAKGNPKQIEKSVQQLFSHNKLTFTNTDNAGKKPLIPLILGFIITIGLLLALLAYLMQHTNDHLPATTQDLNHSQPNNELILSIQTQQLEESRNELLKEQNLKTELAKWITEQNTTIELLTQDTQKLQKITQAHNLHKADVVKQKNKSSSDKTKPSTNQPNNLTKLNNPLPQELALLTLKPNNFSLQLIGLSQEDKVHDFVKNNNLAGKSWYYRSTFNNKPWYIVVYGNYNSLTLANNAIQDLPYTLQKLRPYPKQIAAIQTAIKNNLQR